MKSFPIFLCLVLLAPVATPALSQTITVQPLTSTPILDGSDSDWQDIQGMEIPLKGDLSIKTVTVKAGVKGEEAFFLFQWKDETKDIQHKPFVWDDKAGKYVAGPQREDRFSINFAMQGDFTADWASGKTFEADMWHWKAARTNPTGLAHDKMTIITDQMTKKSFHFTLKDGRTVFVIRPGDTGSKLYSTKRYATKEKQVMPKYILTENPTGSVADVKAKGAWVDGTWTLEMKRLLNTGNEDDVIFEAGKSIKGAIGVFDRSGDANHNISSTLLFQF